MAFLLGRMVYFLLVLVTLFVISWGALEIYKKFKDVKKDERKNENEKNANAENSKSPLNS